MRQRSEYMPYTKLKVWEKSHRLAKAIYKVSEDFPKDEKYGLTSQIRRASTSIPINIAEGKGTRFKAKFISFLDIAHGSAYEVDYLLRLTNEIGYLEQKHYAELTKETKDIINMLSSLNEKK